MKTLLIIIGILVSVAGFAQTEPIAPEYIRTDSIVGFTTDVNLKLVGRGTGLVEIEGAYTLPGTDGSDGQVLTTDGNGSVGFEDVTTVTFGTDNQIPFVNAGGTDFDYSGNLTFDGSTWTLTGAGNITGDLDVDNLNFNGNTITNSAGDITLTPNSSNHLNISAGGLEIGGTQAISSTRAASFTTAGFSGAITVQNGLTVSLFGADNAADGTVTNATNKGSRIGFPHYLTAEEPIAFLFGSNTSTTNVVNIGGGTGTMNAATTINFRTAANNTTTTGTTAMSIDGSQNVTLVGLSGTGDDIVYANSSGTLTRSTVDITDLVSQTTGTFTPTITNGPSLTSANAQYSIIGQQVCVTMQLVWSANADTDLLDIRTVPSAVEPSQTVFGVGQVTGGEPVTFQWNGDALGNFIYVSDGSDVQYSGLIGCSLSICFNKP